MYMSMEGSEIYILQGNNNYGPFCGVFFMCIVICTAYEHLVNK